MLFDTHCHLDFDDFKDDLPQVISRAEEKGIKFFVNAGCDLESSRRSLELAGKYNFIFPAIGIHPHNSLNATTEIWTEFEKMTREKIVAVGECGLDYYRKLSPREKQVEIFGKQIELAKKSNLPLILHSREAEDDMLSILKDYDVKQAVAHCFSGGRKYLDFCAERGFFISFSGNITYPKAENLRALAKETPLELLLLETDCPFLPPQPARGQRCEPQYLTFTRDEISCLKGIEPEKIEKITTANALRCFKINLNTITLIG